MDALGETENRLQHRILEAQREFQEIVERLISGDDATIDVRSEDPLVAFVRSYETTFDPTGQPAEGDGTPAPGPARIA